MLAIVNGDSLGTTFPDFWKLCNSRNKATEIQYTEYLKHGDDDTNNGEMKSYRTGNDTLETTHQTRMIPFCYLDGKRKNLYKNQ